ncbi:hypothetical protein [Psychroflexus sediminis]|uniref:Uncharacterized protein n=1 Tax=Psychroflexus sediminis TaxID=470826 RepID=A0A1G7VC11_9FLAO|nr:hypothetical protein [Psychroflexus sediminis]SDG57088.1 hypothetical protein SAMN04488027_103209 [Psychroflexus sediminis]
MKRFLKILKIIGLGVLGLIIVVTLIGFFMSEDLPEGKQGPEADRFAQQILKELNYEAFQNTEIISWTFADLHSYEWHKDKNYVLVTSDNYKVKLNLKDYDKSEVISSKDQDSTEIIQTSIKNFNNDSYWLIAPYKIMEDHVERRLVTKDGEKSLLVTFTSGGSTPGDSYLWKVDENYRPTAFEMWVSIIPVGGIEAKWKDWVETQSGMILSTKKSVFGIPIEITNLKTSR